MKGTIIVRVKISYKMVPKKRRQLMLKGREQSITGSEFRNLKKYELRVVLLLDDLWESLIPDSLVLDAEKDRRLGLIISKLLEGI